VFERRGDVALWKGDFDAAKASYDAALALPISDNEMRGIQLKRAGASDPNLAPAVVRYFGLYETKSDVVEQAVQRLFEATRIRALDGYGVLGDYLVARQLLNIQDEASAVEPLRRVLDPAPNDHGLPSAEFVREARQMAMTAFLVTGRCDAARDVLAQLRAEDGIGNGHRLELEYWAGRIEFFDAWFGNGNRNGNG
jgi:predicted TPR repeat methyltransferase